MPDQKTMQRRSKRSPTRALQFSPVKNKDVSLITSSVRKQKKEHPEKEARVTGKRGGSQPSYKARQPLPTEELPSPELKRRKVESEEQQREEYEPEELHNATDRNPSEEAQTANPPRPPPELPPGIPAPPIPQGRIQQPAPDHGHLPPGTKPKGVLQTIFSPMFHLFQQPGEGSQDGSAGMVKDEKAPAASDGSQEQDGVGKRSTPLRSSPRKSRSKSPEQPAQKERKEGSSQRVREPEEAAAPDKLRPNSEAEPAAKAAVANGPASGAAASDGASSTDRESETCVETIPAATSTPRAVPEDSEGESEMGEEVHVHETTDEMDEDSLEFDPYAFIKSLPPLEQCAPACRASLLPKQTRQCKRKTLVLDLDETLVHSTLDGSTSTDFRFEVFFNNRTHSVNVRQRPHLAAFLERCATLFEVVIFTASQRLYAEQLLNILDPKRKLIRHRIFRDDCVFVEGNYLKDLTVLGRDLAHTIIVDNSPQAFGFQLANGVPIESWYDDATDTELVRLLPFLESLVHVPDVRPVIVNAFKLHRLVAQAPQH